MKGPFCDKMKEVDSQKNSNKKEELLNLLGKATDIAKKF